MISTPAFLISKRKAKSFDDIRKCRKDINIIKSAITSDSSNYMGAGAHAKMKKCMPGGHIFFSGKSPTFSASCKISTHCDYKWEV